MDTGGRIQNPKDNPANDVKHVDKPGVKKYVRASKFRVGDMVYLIRSDGSRDGPYQIADIPTARKYALCDKNGDAISGAEEIAESALESA